MNGSLIIDACIPIPDEGGYGDNDHWPRTEQAAVRATTAGNAEQHMSYHFTPDGRYFVVRGRLWRCSDPSLPAARREQLTHDLMAARRDKGRAMRAGDADAREQARRQVDATKQQLGERGAVWWTDGAPDWNRHMARNTPYADWFARLATKER